MSTYSKINDYFDKKGISVSYNTLNATELLIRAYLKQFSSRVNSFGNKASQTIKHECYNSIYDIAPRKKYTGFEKLSKLDRELRTHLSPLITDKIYPWSTELGINDTADINITYKDALRQHVKTLNNSLLYLSGGLDSELVGLAMLDAGIKFIPVIWEFTDNNNQIINQHDIVYAYEFCKNNGLMPIIKSVNLEELWKSSDFVNLALDVQLFSPHFLTHCYMINEMSKQFSDKTHVFGGEVRFSTDHALEDGTPANMIFLAKESAINLGYNNQTYTYGSSTDLGPFILSWYFENPATYAPGAALNWHVGRYTRDLFTGQNTVFQGDAGFGAMATASTQPLPYQTVWQLRLVSVLEITPPGSQSALIDPNITAVSTYFPDSSYVSGAGVFPYTLPFGDPGSNITFLFQTTAQSMNTSYVSADVKIKWTFQLRAQNSPSNFVESNVTFRCYSGAAP